MRAVANIGLGIHVEMFKTQQSEVYNSHLTIVFYKKRFFGLIYIPVKTKRLNCYILVIYLFIYSIVAVIYTDKKIFFLQTEFVISF